MANPPVEEAQMDLVPGQEFSLDPGNKSDDEAEQRIVFETPSGEMFAGDANQGLWIFFPVDRDTAEIYEDNPAPEGVHNVESSHNRQRNSETLNSHDQQDIIGFENGHNLEFNSDFESVTDIEANFEMQVDDEGAENGDTPSEGTAEETEREANDSGGDDSNLE